MYTQVASRLAIAMGTSEVSQAIPTEGYNQARTEFTIFNGSLTTIEVWESNDLENWTVNEVFAAGWVGPVYGSPLPTVKVTSAYIRIKWTTDVAACVVAGGVNLSSQ